MSVGTALREAAGAVPRAVGSVRRPDPGRRHRRMWVGDGRAHIEVRAVDRHGSQDMARHLERAVQRIEGVHWAQVNAVLGRLVVAFDPDGVSVDDIVGVVEGVEAARQVADERFAHGVPEHPGDPEPVRRAAIALGADIAGLGAGIFGQLLRLTPLPAELASLVALAENEPRIRHWLEQTFGVAATDLGLGLSSAALQAVSQGPLSLVVDAAHRATVLSELQAQRRVWEERERALCAEPADEPVEPAGQPVRPVPLPAGPIERYADRAALGSLGAFAVALATTGSPRRASAVVIAGLPKAARHGREAFAAHLGRVLARRGVVVMDRTVLRRLDRIDTVVLAAAAVTTGTAELGPAEVCWDLPTVEADGQFGRLFDPARPDRVRRRGGWACGPLASLRDMGVTIPRGAVTRARAVGGGHMAAVALARRGRVVALAPVDDVVDPLAAPLVAAARRGAMTVLVAGGRGDVADRCGAQGTVPGGRQLARSVRSLQRDGRAVLLVASAARRGERAPGADVHGALQAADCGIGLAGDGYPPAWGGHLLTGPGLADAHLVVEAAAAASQVSSRSALLALAGSGAGGLWALAGPARGAGRRAALPMNMAAAVAQAQGALSASAVGRRPGPLPRPQTSWHAMSGEEALRALGSSPGGLPGDEAARRTAEPDPPPSPASRLGQAVVTELRNPLTPVLAAGAGLAAGMGSMVDAGLVAGVTAANAVMGGVQRLRADASIDRLLRADDTTVGTRRSGRVVPLSRPSLVPGDVVELGAGEVVPADCRILQATACEVDESALTGESMPVAKQAVATPGAPVVDRSCMLYEGTTLSSGSVLAVVVAVGADTEVGRSLADVPEPPASGVEARLRSLTAATVPATVASGAAVAGLGLLHGRSPRRALAAGASLTVAAVPEGLPLLATMAQQASARRLAERGALVRNPRTIEALGRVDTLCFDKTGTLTLGEISLQRVSDGATDEPVAELGPRSRAVLAAGLRASPDSSDGVASMLHATDRAVVAGAERAGVAAAEGLAGWSAVGELAFDPARGFHAVVGAGPGGTRISVKGAPEVILPRCTTWAAPDGCRTVDGRARRRLQAEVERLARRGLRVLAVAERPAAPRLEDASRPVTDERVAGMELLGFLGLADSVRPAAAAAVADLRAAGVQVSMITGDHPGTAGAIGAELGLLGQGHARSGPVADGTVPGGPVAGSTVPGGWAADGAVLSGPAIDALSDDELAAAVTGVSVFARVTPTNKVRIVRALQAAGRVVAMTGDGANDAPAIRMAHTGIALGARSVPAAREAADVVLLDDRIETILDAVAEGRAMWLSVRDALAILVGGNMGEVAFTLAATALTGVAPLGTRQLLVVNLLTDLLPATTIAVQPPRRTAPAELLRQGPDASLGAGLRQQIVLRAAMTAAGAGGAWLVARGTGSRRRASTVALVALVGSQLGQTAVVGSSSPLVVASAVASAAALVAVVQTPGISHMVGCTPLGPVGWGIAAGSATAATAASVALPWAARRLSRGATTGARQDP